MYEPEYILIAKRLSDVFTQLVCSAQHKSISLQNETSQEKLNDEKT